MRAARFPTTVTSSAVTRFCSAERQGETRKTDNTPEWPCRSPAGPFSYGEKTSGFGGQRLLDVGHQAAAVRRRHAVVGLHRAAIAGNQVFVEVPLGARARQLDEVGEQGVGLSAFDAALGEHRELHPKGVGAKLGNLLTRVGLLLAEVVGREAQDDQAAFFVLGVERFQALVLAGVAAIARGIDHQYHLASVLAEVLRRIVLQAGELVLQQGGAGGSLGVLGGRCHGQQGREGQNRQKE